jgi:4-amino-4-deoxy-L-arabinose transferase-like glycosyltransferase
MAPLKRLLPVAVLLTAYTALLLIVPPTVPVPLVDDWVYQPSVAHLVDRHELWIAPPTVATLVLQVAWGGLFGWLFGVSPVVLRCSTLVAGFGAALACYGLFRELDVGSGRAVLGALAVCVNPLVFFLSRTFMSDVPYLALLCLASYLAVRAVNRDSVTGLAAASAAAGAAFLVRQQGALIPVAIVAWLGLTRARPFRAAPVRTLAAAVVPCAVAVAGYAIWASRAGLPAKQHEFLDAVRVAGPWVAIQLVWRLATVGLFYAGLFVFPIVVGLARELPAIWRRAGAGARAIAIIGLVVMGLWTNSYAVANGGWTFPFVPYGSVIHQDGLGTLSDVTGDRGSLLPTWAWAALAIVFALAVTIAFLLVAGRDDEEGRDGPARHTRTWQGPVGLVLALGAGQFVGMIPPSLPIAQLIAYDRYYMPLLPFVVGLVLWAARRHRFAPAPALVALLLLAAIDTAGVEDWFAFKDAYWQEADSLVAQGVPARQVDGGLEWDGAHFYEASLANPQDRAPDQPGAAWWIGLFAPQIDPVYVVASVPDPPPGYHPYAKRPYRSWIRPASQAWVYVWQRDGTTGS